jgi:dihydrofolate reductase
MSRVIWLRIGLVPSGVEVHCLDRSNGIGGHTQWLPSIDARYTWRRSERELAEQSPKQRTAYEGPLEKLSRPPDAMNEKRKPIESMLPVISDWRRERWTADDVDSKEKRRIGQRRPEMGKIVVSENITLDGVVEDPSGAEGFKFGGWVGRIGDRGREGAAKVLLDEALGAEAQLFGRRTYEFLAARWPSRTGVFADRFNSMPKYVVSSTLKHPDWNNSTVLKGDAVSEVTKLRQQVNGEIVVAGSLQLVRTLFEHGLVDELRLMTYPVVLGAGIRLFGETSKKKHMTLLETRTLDDLAYLTYAIVGDA